MTALREDHREAVCVLFAQRADGLLRLRCFAARAHRQHRNLHASIAKELAQVNPLFIERDIGLQRDARAVGDHLLRLLRRESPIFCLQTQQRGVFDCAVGHPRELCKAACAAFACAEPGAEEHRAGKERLVLAHEFYRKLRADGMPHHQHISNRER
ncbi:hypothetical protein SDC9_124100 [bioreactor metagenome]|uniref:Uncharacterized protein n=1 Tax=bioreactor metagenome TaxID=1076179 RepID=A0A645CJG9_9ZZZZ